MNDLVGWWPLHEQSGQANDLSGNGNHGSVAGTVRGVAGKGGLRGTYFDGTDDTITVSDSSEIQLDGESFTIVTVVAPDAMTTHRFCYQKWRPNAYFHNTSGFNFEAEDANGNQSLSMSTPTYDGQTWIMLIQRVTDGYFHEGFVYDKNGLYDYSNTSFGSATGSNGDNLVLAKSGWHASGNSTWGGTMSGFHLYKRPISNSEIEALYDFYFADTTQPPVNGTSYFPLDGNAVDQWGANDGTVTGAVETNTAIRGTAYSFDGTDDVIDVPHIDTIDFTFSAWVHVDSLAAEWDTLVMQRNSDGTNRKGWNIYINRDNDYWDFWAAGNVDSVWRTITGPNVQTGVWTHVVMTGETDTFIEGWINGERVGRIDNTDLYLNAENDAMTIGDGADTINGVIDDVRIYPRALSPAEIRQLYVWGTRGRDMLQYTVNK